MSHLVRHPESSKWRIFSVDRPTPTGLVDQRAYAEENGWAELEFDTLAAANYFLEKLLAVEARQTSNDTAHGGAASQLDSFHSDTIDSRHRSDASPLSVGPLRRA
jgi:hypothetical protein